MKHCTPGEGHILYTYEWGRVENLGQVESGMEKPAAVGSWLVPSLDSQPSTLDCLDVDACWLSSYFLSFPGCPFKLIFNFCRR